MTRFIPGIKLMIDFKEITIDDKEIFDRYLKYSSPEISEMTFTNFFMWKEFYRFRFAVINGFLCIISQKNKGKPFTFCPMGEPDKDNFISAVNTLKEYFKENNWNLIFERVEEKQLKIFKEYLGEKIDYSYDRNNSDYVYLREDLVHLHGKKLHAKRNHINKFKKLYNYEYYKLEKSHIEDCIRIMNDWCEDTECDCVKGEFCERYANTELLNNYEKLGCRGALIKVDDKFEAFTVGEKLNDEMAIIHIEKANRRIEGLYTIINQQFCEKEWDDAIYINREQDLGIEGLRKAKLSYHPVKMVDKYIVTLN